MAKLNGKPAGATRPVAPPRSAEEVASHKAIRERFQRERPTLEQLVSSGEYNEPLPMGEFLSIRVAISALKKAREAAGLSLADVAERTGIDKSALSKIETGQHMNPTVSTLCRYAHALGMQWKWSLEDENNEATRDRARIESVGFICRGRGRRPTRNFEKGRLYSAVDFTEMASRLINQIFNDTMDRSLGTIGDLA